MNEDLLRQGLEQFVSWVIQASKEAGQEASGKTYQNITIDVYRNGGQTIGEVWAPNYFYTLIRGRGPGKTPANFTQIIMEWARYKNIVFQSESDLKRFAYFTMKKMREEGSELYRNHLYVDILDTPADRFEEWLDEQLNVLLEAEITRAFNAEGTSNHGYIL